MKLSSEVVWRYATHNQVLVLSLGNEHYFELNATGSLLWKQLDGDGVSGTEDLVQSLVDHFDVPRERATTDVETFLASLQAMGALER